MRWSPHFAILRLDFDAHSAGLAYRIPPDNPVGSRQETQNEICAYGVRNPWGMFFDCETGTLWCGDVGQDRWKRSTSSNPAATTVGASAMARPITCRNGYDGGSFR